jgi:hypothetical protein
MRIIFICDADYTLIIGHASSEFVNFYNLLLFRNRSRHFTIPKPAASRIFTNCYTSLFFRNSKHSLTLHRECEHSLIAPTRKLVRLRRSAKPWQVQKLARYFLPLSGNSWKTIFVLNSLNKVRIIFILADAKANKKHRERNCPKMLLMV